MPKAFVVEQHEKYDFSGLPYDVVSLVEKGDPRPSVGDPTGLAGYLYDMLRANGYAPGTDAIILSGHSVSVALLLAVVLDTYKAPVRMFIYSTKRRRYEEKVLSSYE